MRFALGRVMSRQAKGGLAMNGGVGDVLSGTMGVVKDRFWSLLGLWGVFFVVQIGLMMLLGVATGATAAIGMAAQNPAALGGGMIFSIFVFYLVYFFIYFAQFSAMMASASPLLRLDFGGALKSGLRSAPFMILVIIVLSILSVVLFMVLGIFGGILSSAGSTVTGLFAIILIPAWVYLVCRISMVYAVVAVERIGNPVTVIARSWSMTRGHVLTIFLSLLVFGIGAMVLFGIMFVPMISSITSLRAGMMPNFGLFGFMFVGIMIATILLTIFGSALLSVIHAQISGSTGEKMDEVFA